MQKKNKYIYLYIMRNTFFLIFYYYLIVGDYFAILFAKVYNVYTYILMYFFSLINFTYSPKKIFM